MKPDHISGHIIFKFLTSMPTATFHEVVEEP